MWLISYTPSALDAPSFDSSIKLITYQKTVTLNSQGFGNYNFAPEFKIDQLIK